MPQILLKERGAFGNADTGGAWLSSARAVRCWVKKICYGTTEQGEEGEEGEDKEEGEEGEEDQAAVTEIGENSHAAKNVDGTIDVSGRNKRKHADQGAESRKKKVLCQLAASSKGNNDADMRKFLEGVVQDSFKILEEKLSQQILDKIDKFETVVIDRLGKIETEVTQLRTNLQVTELAGKNDQPNVPSKGKTDTGPTTSQKDSSIKEKVSDIFLCLSTGCEKKKLKADDIYVNLPRVNLTQSSAIDLCMSIQEVMESCLKDLFEELVVNGFNLSQPKAKDSLEWFEPPTSLKITAPRLDDRKMEQARKDDPDSCLVFVREEYFMKMHEWTNTNTGLLLGPSILDQKLGLRVVSKTSWLQNYPFSNV
ncbi:unnamed protein product [Eruca vesicaria subsp. sativa]|uniref:Uncharacterized protein n=1 Tax=Eruca vesicaria subsp. sativa TaxID=29727 RepID=A0ABC8IU94_ERUVS|nr:unnamed protein product [Eruca vesicaria subsp. sativa]